MQDGSWGHQNCQAVSSNSWAGLTHLQPNIDTYIKRLKIKIEQINKLVFAM